MIHRVPKIVQLGLIIATTALLGAACSTGTTYTATVGFVHNQQTAEIGNTDATGWAAGGNVGFEFEGSGLSAVELCGLGGFQFIGADSDLEEGEVTAYTNSLPLSLCSRFSTK